MAKSFREKVESLVFAGLKPGEPAAQSKSIRWLGPLRQPWERFLNAGASDDPLYLTNRTWRQRARVWVLVALPCVLVAAAVAFALLGFVQKRDAASKELTPAQMAAKLLPPDLDKNIQIHDDRPVDVAEVRVEHAGTTRLVGAVRNRTDKALAHAQVIFDLADARGSRLGAVSAEVEHVPPRGTAPFDIAIEQSTAVVAIVREVHTQ
jgi:hypothetical protein